MTFSALSYLTWYRKYRNYIIDLVNTQDFAEAETLLTNLIVEHRTIHPVNDNGHNRSELGHMEHALKHIRHRQPDDTDYIKSKIPTILSYDPEQFDPHDMSDDSN